MGENIANHLYEVLEKQHMMYFPSRKGYFGIYITYLP